MALAHRKGKTTSKGVFAFCTHCMCAVCLALNNLFICAYKSLMLLLLLRLPQTIYARFCGKAAGVYTVFPYSISQFSITLPKGIFDLIKSL